MRPGAGEVLHFSEDPAITRFVPHVAGTAQQAEAYVWAVDQARAPDYWFPRSCPRALAWVDEQTTHDDRDRIIGAGCGDRVHVIEYRWLKRIADTQLFAYRLPADMFRPFDAGSGVSHAQVATVPVEPLGPPELVGDLLDRHAEAGIQFRVLDNLWPFWDVVVTTSLGFSGIRLRNARARLLA